MFPVVFLTTSAKTMAMRKDLDTFAEWLRSDKDQYFEKALRDLRSILPDAIRAYDRTTAERLVDELISSFWYWDKRVLPAKSRKEMREEEFQQFLAEREKARARRDALIELLLLGREVTDHMRLKRHGEKKHRELARHLGEKIDECERQWDLIVEKRIAEGEQADRWVVRLR